MNYNTLDYACSYILSGFTIIPLKPKGITPAICDSKGRHQGPAANFFWLRFRGSDAVNKTLEEWFGNDSENNIGIVTGPDSNIVIVDIDDMSVFDSIKKYCSKPTPTVITSRGLHLYYGPSTTEDYFNHRKDLAGINLRVEDGFVVAPPSIHPNGHKYIWMDEARLGDVLIARLPRVFVVDPKEVCDEQR